MFVFIFYPMNLEIVFVGDENVGKTCLISSYIGKELVKTEDEIHFVECQVPVGKDHFIHLKLIDVKGKYKEKFKNLNKNTIVVYVYDLMEPKSFENISLKWSKLLPKITQTFLIGTKLDLLLDEKESEKGLILNLKDMELLSHKLGCIQSFAIYYKDEKLKSIFNEMIKCFIQSKTYEDTFINLSEVDLEHDMFIKHKELKIPVHKTVISISPFFKKKLDEKEIEIDLDEKSIISILQLIYGGKLEEEITLEELKKISHYFEYEIPKNELERQALLFNHFQKEKDGKKILYKYFNISKKSIEMDLLILNNFSSEVMMKMKWEDLCKIYKDLPDPWLKYKVSLWIITKLSPLNVEDIIEKVIIGNQIHSQLLSERCAMWMRVLQLISKLNLKNE